MDHGLLFITGFGAFEDVDVNPSGHLARTLGADTGVRGLELPVSFRAAPLAIDAALEELAPSRPLAILATGVHPGSSFRLERRARARLGAGRPDNDGVSADALEIADSPDLETALELELLAESLRAAGASQVELSRDAGGYVCERVYRHVLEIGEREGIPALFLHVPPVAFVPVAEQLAPVRALMGALRRACRGAAQGSTRAT